MTIPGLVVKKVGMTRVLDESGRMVPVTLLKAEGQQITKLLSQDKDGYQAVQVGYDEKRAKLLTKADQGRLKKSGVDKCYSKFLEFRLPADESSLEAFKVADAMSVEGLQDIASVDVTGLTRGRGFQGTTKRYNTATGRRTHGSRYHRRTGSIGQCQTPGRVYKNKKMPGHMGVEKQTVQNLRVVDVDAENNTIALKGSVPGFKGGFLVVRPSVKLKQEVTHEN